MCCSLLRSRCAARTCQSQVDNATPPVSHDAVCDVPLLRSALYLPPPTAPKALHAPHARLLSVLKAEIRTEDDHLSAHPDSLACAASLWITAPPRSPTAAPPLLLPSPSILSSPITSTLSLCSSLPTWPALPAFVSCIDGDQLLPTRPQCCVTSLEVGR